MKSISQYIIENCENEEIDEAFRTRIKRWAKNKKDSIKSSISSAASNAKRNIGREASKIGNELNPLKNK